MTPQIIYQDPVSVVAIKPAGVLSPDEPGGMPELVRQALGIRDVRTVHRLDRVVSGLMVLARTKRAASDLSQLVEDLLIRTQQVAEILGGQQIVGRLGGCADQNDQYAFGHGVQCTAVAGAPGLEHPTEPGRHILTGPALRLVYNYDSVHPFTTSISAWLTSSTVCSRVASRLAPAAPL